MRESRKPPSFWKERSPESSDILRAFIILLCLLWPCPGSVILTVYLWSCPGYVILAFYLWSCPGSGILAVILRSCMVLSSSLSVASLIHITAITLYCRLLYRTAMFVNQRWACSSLMTTIQMSWNLSQYSNINQQWYIIIWTHYTSVIIYFVQLFTFKKGGSVMV